MRMWALAASAILLLGMMTLKAQRPFREYPGVEYNDFPLPDDLSDLLNRSGISLVADRIESEGQVVDLLDFDLRFGQGFLFSPPRPVRAEAPEPAKLHTGFKFTEGPAADLRGNLYFTDIPNNRIHKSDADGKLSTFFEDSKACNGLMIDSRGRMVACQGGEKRVVAIDLASKAVDVLADRCDGKPVGTPNDLVIASGPEDGACATTMRIRREGNSCAIAAPANGARNSASFPWGATTSGERGNSEGKRLRERRCSTRWSLAAWVATEATKRPRPMPADTSRPVSSRTLRRNCSARRAASTKAWVRGGAR